jgi:hypothetical protein
VIVIKGLRKIFKKEDKLFAAIETFEDSTGVITRPVLRYHSGDYETGAKIPHG